MQCAVDVGQTKGCIEPSTGHMMVRDARMQARRDSVWHRDARIACTDILVSAMHAVLRAHYEPLRQNQFND